MPDELTRFDDRSANRRHAQAQEHRPERYLRSPRMFVSAWPETVNYHVGQLQSFPSWQLADQCQYLHQNWCQSQEGVMRVIGRLSNPPPYRPFTFHGQITRAEHGRSRPCYRPASFFSIASAPARRADLAAFGFKLSPAPMRSTPFLSSLASSITVILS